MELEPSKFDQFATTFGTHILEYRPDDTQLLNTQWKLLAETRDFLYLSWDISSIDYELLVTLGDQAMKDSKNLESTKLQLFHMCLIGQVTGGIVINGDTYIVDEDRAAEFIKQQVSKDIVIYQSNDKPVFVVCKRGNQKMMDKLKDMVDGKFPVDDEDFVKIDDNTEFDWLKF